MYAILVLIYDHLNDAINQYITVRPYALSKLLIYNYTWIDLIVAPVTSIYGFDYLELSDSNNYNIDIPPAGC